MLSQSLCLGLDNIVFILWWAITVDRVAAAWHSAEKNSEAISGFNQRVLQLINNAFHGRSRGRNGPCAISSSCSSRPLTVSGTHSESMKAGRA